MAARSRHDAVCLSGSKGSDAGRRWVRGVSPSSLPFVSPHLTPRLSTGPGPRIKIRVADGRLRRHTPSTHPCGTPHPTLTPAEASVPSTIQYCSCGRRWCWAEGPAGCSSSAAAAAAAFNHIDDIDFVFLKTLMGFIVSF